MFHANSTANFPQGVVVEFVLDGEIGRMIVVDDDYAIPSIDLRHFSQFLELSLENGVPDQTPDIAAENDMWLDNLNFLPNLCGILIGVFT